MILESAKPKSDSENHDHVYPLYGGQSLVNVPHTISRLLGVSTDGIPIDEKLFEGRISTKGIKKVVMILLDGFGYNMWVDSNSYPGFFNKIADKGLLIPITTVFPSTTASGVTSANTGLEPAQHGLPEWVVYMKEFKMIIITLPFTMLMSQKRVHLDDLGFDAKVLYRGPTVYEMLGNFGVKSFTLMPKSIAGGVYTGLIKKGSNTMPFVSMTDGVIRLANLINSEEGVCYINFYSDSIDSVTHAYGPYSEESRAEIRQTSRLLDEELIKRVDRKAADETLIIVTADHGHAKVDPKKTVYLNGDRKLLNYLAKDGGKKILPTGSSRNVFLHIDPDHLADAYEHLTKRFSGKAQVIYSKDAIKMGLFGTSKPCKRLVDRIGDIMILPNEGELVWYEHMKGRKFNLMGMHGGLSQDEMVIPLAMARLSDLL